MRILNTADRVAAMAPCAGTRDVEFRARMGGGCIQPRIDRQDSTARKIGPAFLVETISLTGSGCRPAHSRAADSGQCRHVARVAAIPEHVRSIVKDRALRVTDLCPT